ncbi:hypothetical protein AX16_009086 [Volvariella volvacea WC 439]|nr:hypothetical protein AX16_009086 [Volvariella volvacea WC 439]
MLSTIFQFLRYSVNQVFANGQPRGGSCSPYDAVRKFLSPSAYNPLYDELWRKGGEPFVLEEVLLEDSSDAPSTGRVAKSCLVWAFHPSPGIDDCIFQSLRVRPFVRDEYHVALADIIKAKRMNDRGVFWNRDDVVEYGVEEQEHYIGACDTSRQYRNPFLDYEESASPDVNGVAVVGHPGIGILALPKMPLIFKFNLIFEGKSIFLYYILLLRLQAQKPTVLVNNINYITVFASEGAFEMEIGHIHNLALFLPPTTWCLVDLNPVDGVDHFPQFFYVYDNSYFAVRALPPEPACDRWLQKEDCAAMWDRRLEHPSISISKLEQYYSRYTPSAAKATSISDLCQTARNMLPGDDGISLLTPLHYTQSAHGIFTVSPDSEFKMRAHPRPEISTWYLTRRLVRTLEQSEHRQALRILFFAFNECLDTALLAASVLDYGLHRILLFSSHWRVRPLTTSEALPHPSSTSQRLNHSEWVSDPTSTSKLILKAQDISIVNDDKVYAGLNKPSDLSFNRFSLHTSASGSQLNCNKSDAPRISLQNKRLISTYFGIGSLMLNGIVFPSPTVALAFQVVSPHSPIVDLRGLEALEAQATGIKEFWYVVVKPKPGGIWSSNVDDTRRVRIPVSHELGPSRCAVPIMRKLLLEISNNDFVPYPTRVLPIPL